MTTEARNIRLDCVRRKKGWFVQRLLLVDESFGWLITDELGPFTYPEEAQQAGREKWLPAGVPADGGGAETKETVKS